MGNRDNWSYIQMPKTVFEQVENMLKTDEFIKKGIFKPKDIALILFRDFIEHGSDMLDNTSKVEKLQIELNAINNMFQMIVHNKTDQKYLENIEHKQTKNKESILIDNNIDKQIKVLHKNKMPYCEYHKTNECVHTLYVSMLSNFVKIEKHNV